MEELYVISAVGKDKPGLVHSVTRVLADQHINIVDVEARAVRGHFTMFLVVDLSTSECSYAEMMAAVEPVGTNFNLGLRVEAYETGRRIVNKHLMLFTLMGRDKPGIVASVSGIFSENSINIENIKMIARGEYIAMEITVDTSDVDDISALRKIFYGFSEKTGLTFP